MELGIEKFRRVGRLHVRADRLGRHYSRRNVSGRHTAALSRESQANDSRMPARLAFLWLRQRTPRMAQSWTAADYDAMTIILVIRVLAAQGP